MAADELQKRRKSQQRTGEVAGKRTEQAKGPHPFPDGFLNRLLAIQCSLARTQNGAILRNGNGQQTDVLAIYPPIKQTEAAPAWLKKCLTFVHQAGLDNGPIQRPLADGTSPQATRDHVIVMPLQSIDMDEIVEVFLVSAPDEASLQTCQQRLELPLGLLRLAEKNLTLQKKEADLQRLQAAMEALSAINRSQRFKGAAMSFCNEIAAQWQCERASIGFLKGKYVRLKAISHGENFNRKMKLVQDIESAMEECLDQDCEVLYPLTEQATYVARATSELSARHGPVSILSLPLRSDGQVQAVVTVERPEDKPFEVEEVETIRLTCDLCTPRLMSLYEHDRWFGARAAAKVRKIASALLGPEHTWAKLLTLLLAGILLFLIFAKGTFRVKAPFVLEATVQQTICAPFDTFIETVDVEVGDTIREDRTALAKLDTVELQLKLAAAEAEREGYLKQVAASMRDGETAQAQIAQANAEKAEAQIELYTYLIDRGTIISPISGTVVEGDLKRQIGAPVQTGDTLFEITPLASLRAELLVPEDQIFDVAEGQEGSLATASYPGERIGFVVERINPAAEVENNRNVFKVRARLTETHPWMRPGMEGVAKVTIGERRYVWIWTRRIVNWLRMKLWL